MTVRWSSDSAVKEKNQSNYFVIECNEDWRQTKTHYTMSALGMHLGFKININNFPSSLSFIVKSRIPIIVNWFSMHCATASHLFVFWYYECLGTHKEQHKSAVEGVCRIVRARQKTFHNNAMSLVVENCHPLIPHTRKYLRDLSCRFCAKTRRTKNELERRHKR